MTRQQKEDSKHTMDSQHVHLAVQDILEKLGSRDTAMMKLIKMTFLAESGLEYFVPDENSMWYGFSQISELDLEDFMFNYVKHHELKKKIEQVCLISLSTDNYQNVLFKLKYDISLQIAITYGIYLSRIDLVPEDGLHECAQYYYKFWCRSGWLDEDLQDLRDDYMDTYVGGPFA